MTRTRLAAANFRAACRVMKVLDVMLPGDDEVGKLLGARLFLEERFNKLTTLEVGSKPFVATLTEVESGVAAMEQELSKVDQGIPMPWFRLHFDPSQASSESLADYASLLGRHSGDDPARLDRVQLLLTRLVHNFIGPGQTLTVGHVQPLLTEALPKSTLPDPKRAAAVAFFRDASKRLAGFKTLTELTDSEFFVDTRGYKLSLRQAILDPEVMATVIEFNEGISAAIDRLAKSELPESEAIEQHMVQVDQRIRSLFKDLRTDDPGSLLEFEKRVAKNTTQPKKKRLKKWATPRKPGTAPARKFRWSYALLALGLVVFALTYPARSNLRELSPAEALDYSPVLVSAALSPPPPRAPMLLLGQVNKSRWALMSSEQRLEAAKSLVAKMKDRGLDGATVLLEDRVVIQIEHGNLLMVQ